MVYFSKTTWSRKRKSFVLLAVLVIVVVLTLAAYQFSDLMLAEYRAADSSMRSVQARALADSGVNYAAALLSNSDAFTNTLNGNPFDNTQAFQGVVVNPQDSPRLQGRFSLIAPLDPDDPSASAQPFRYGVNDESARINLNTFIQLDSSGKVLHDMLLTLPNMTEDIANSILDWIDPDDDPRANGAENDYYQTLTPPYSAKNGPLDSLEELLLVKGVTPQLLLGNDRNRNGILDPDEDDGSGTLDRGWSAYLTVYSREQNVDSQGNPRIYVNDRDLQGLYQKLATALGSDLANYILAYRLYGPAPTQAKSPTPMGTGSSGTATPGSATSQGMNPAGGQAASAPAPGQQGLSRSSLDFQRGRPQSIASLYELINSKVSFPGPNPNAPATTYPSPLNDPASLRNLLPQVLDQLTTVNSQEIPARINVNTASRTVLMALPGMGDSDVQSILDQRPNTSSKETPDPIFQTPAWLITEANFPPAKLRSLERYITARTQVYRFQAVGFFDKGGPTARIEAVIDTNQGTPRVIYWRDLSELGKGFTQ